MEMDMEILIAKSTGFCFGVKRAIKEAEKTAEEKGSHIYTLGPIIHNPQVVGRLEEKGIYTKNSLDDIDGGTIIIRSHGVKVEEFIAAGQKGLDIVDATCPFVKKAQDLVSRLTAEGYTVVVAGKREHPEVKGLVSYGSRDLWVAETPDDLRGMKRCPKIGIVAQTTLAMKKLETIVNFCLSLASEIKVFNTICNATSIRQEECADLAGHVDVMVVVGGRNSSNTMRLTEICSAVLDRTHHVETADELKAQWFKDCMRVGVTSGASTPDWIIREVVEKIAKIGPK
ncbi:MAG: 4-hydroxy-3-methylbut-2-enyl diphosphate reductase [Thermodesulfobacteriota bacterium]|nr:MAG: 4-hydroxy-3-methylbut-2-enyl diphosphate reductase [Thermodesulfobacteriota bacterium]